MCLLLLVACVCAVPAFAVPVDVGCPPEPIPPSQPPGDVSGGGVFLLSPASSSLVPRNVDLVLGGSTVDIALGFWRVDLMLVSGVVVPSRVVDSHVVVDGGLLPANANLRLVIGPSDSHPCQGCFASQEFGFATNDVVDTTAPALNDSIVQVNGFVLPSPAEKQACGSGAGLHAVDVRFTPSEPAFFTVAGRSAHVGPTVLLNHQFVDSQTQMTLSFGADVAFSLGEPIVVIITAEDLAGNASPPRAMRLRMRSFRDRNLPELVPLSCSLDPAPDIFVPARLSTHPALKVVFPFEELPMALRPLDSSGDDVPLVAVADVVEDARAGHVYQSARPIDAGRYDVVAGDCARCVCPQCNSAPRTRIVIEDVVDEQAPAAPHVLTVVDDPSPELSVGECVADDAATLFVLTPGSDDISPPLDLLYDAVIRPSDGLPRPAGAALAPWQRANGDVVVRIPSGPFGRLVGTAFTLTLSARDASGKATQTTYENPSDEAGGCAAAPMASFGALVALVRRRRR